MSLKATVTYFFERASPIDSDFFVKKLFTLHISSSIEPILLTSRKEAQVVWCYFKKSYSVSKSVRVVLLLAVYMYMQVRTQVYMYVSTYVYVYNVSCVHWRSNADTRKNTWIAWVEILLAREWGYFDFRTGFMFRFSYFFSTSLVDGKLLAVRQMCPKYTPLPICTVKERLGLLARIAGRSFLFVSIRVSIRTYRAIRATHESRTRDILPWRGRNLTSNTLLDFTVFQVSIDYSLSSSFAPHLSGFEIKSKSFEFAIQRSQNRGVNVDRN